MKKKSIYKCIWPTRVTMVIYGTFFKIWTKKNEEQKKIKSKQNHISMTSLQTQQTDSDSMGYHDVFVGLETARTTESLSKELRGAIFVSKTIMDFYSKALSSRRQRLKTQPSSNCFVVSMQIPLGMICVCTHCTML